MSTQLHRYCNSNSLAKAKLVEHGTAIHIMKSPVREIRTPGSVQGRGGNPTPTAITAQEIKPNFKEILRNLKYQYESIHEE
jgi:hypothetical protein